MHKSLGLALGSGGARGVAHVGFLKSLEEAEIKPDYIAGCSMGAVVGGCYASGVTVDEMKSIIFKLKPRHIIDINPVAISQMALLRSRKVRDLLLENVKVENIEDFPLPFKCVATDLLSGKLHVFDKGAAAFAIQASSSIPSVFRPVPFEDKLLVDGGCLCRVPIKQVKEMGADVVIAVDVLKNASEPTDKVSNIVSVLLRVFDIMDSKISAFSLEANRDICDLYLEPEMKGLSQYHIKDLEKAYYEGYELGKQNIPKIKELLSY